MLKLTILFACLMQASVLCDEAPNGYYTVIAPGTVRSNSEYTVAVTSHGIPSKIKVGVSSDSFKDEKTVDVEKDQTEIVKFSFPELKEGEYNLTAEGLTGIEFKNTTTLNFERKYYSVYIQTDKATYKPGDLVRFRILVLDGNTRPIDLGKTTVGVAISDSDQNRIKQFKNIELKKGVYSEELQLSSFPVLGDWKIEVSVGDQKTKKEFEVAKYVLPKFEVEVDTPKHITLKDNKVVAIIRSKYTYGKPVKGKAVVTIKRLSHSYYDKGQVIKTEKVVAIDGKGRVEFSLSDDLNYNLENFYTPSLEILAIVEEELTGLKQNSTATVNIHKDRYKIESLSKNTYGYYYEPGKPLEIKVVVKLFDETPVQHSKNPIVLEVEEPSYYPRIVPIHPRPGPIYRGPGTVHNPTQFSEEIVGTPTLVLPPTPKTMTIEAQLDENGIAKFEVIIPTHSDKNFYYLKVKYLDQTSHLGSLSKKQPTLNFGNFFSVEIQTEKPTLDNEVSVRVSSNRDIPHINYDIVGRGNIIKSEKLEVPEKRNYHVFKFKPTFEMIPDANILVYYIDKEGNLIFAESSITFEQKLENFVKINLPAQAKPGDNIDIKVSSNPDSYVGLMGVDQSVLLLKSGNDITKKSVFDEITQFKTRTPLTRGYGRYPGESSGLVTLTNSHFPYEEFPMPMPFSSPGMGYSPVVGSSMHSIPMTASASMPGTTSTPLVVPVRKEFPETWLWVHSSDQQGGDGEFTISSKVPDTITSWVLTGFSVNPKTGLGLTQSPKKLQVFQPFFISTNLPYSVKRGEVISIPVIVFNYLENDLNADIVMSNEDGDFEFTEATNEVDEKTIDEVKLTKKLSIPGNSGKSVSFMIRPKQVGHISIAITATTPVAGDSIQQMLLVEPEGVTHYVNKAIFVNLNKDKKEQIETIDIEIPENAVPDSEYVTISVAGDPLSPTVNNLDKLVRMPQGCGEQNMVNFVPNILVLKYLSNDKQWTPYMEGQAKKYLEIGYQKELTYKHDDGSYSAFGKSDGNGSTWLTAYVAKSFHQAIPFTDIDNKVIAEALSFLANLQSDDGHFVEYGKVIDKAHSGDSETGIALTAFVLLAFLENSELRPKYADNIQRGLKYLAANIDKEEDVYSLAITAYALQLAKHEHAEKTLARLQPISKAENDLKWWAKEKKGDEEKVDDEKVDFNQRKPKSCDVEMTSYALLALLEEPTVTNKDAVSILRWLISKRNSNGGFSSTQDTVVGLQALISFSEKFSSGGENDIEIAFTDEEETNGIILVNEDNALVFTTYGLPPTAKKIDIKAKGQGSTLVQVSYNYNVISKNTGPRFIVKPTVKNSHSKELLKLEVCVNYVPQDHDTISNMAVVEVNLPSGYTASENDGTLDDLINNENVKRVETKNKDSAVIVYFDNLDENILCVPVDATKTSNVAKQKPSAVQAYDYYSPGNQGIEYYTINSSLCDICEGDDCGQGCSENSTNL